MKVWWSEIPFGLNVISFLLPTILSFQEEILMVENQKGLLEDMNTIQQSADMRNMLTFIEKIYEKVDFVWET